MTVLDTEAYLDQVCRMLEAGHENVPVPIRGVSMRPFLRDGDYAYLISLPDRIKAGDILLFRRPNGQYVLHRVHKRRRDGSFLLLGDSQLAAEPVDREQLLAKTAFVRRKDRICRPGGLCWWFFACPWRLCAPLRPLIGKALALLRRK
jgi:hypothetical protein